jgi:hypothetical protein
MRSDPLYFHTNLLSVNQHRPERIQGVQHIPKDVYYDRLVEFIAYDTYEAAVWWSVATKEVENLERAYHKYKDTITVGKPLNMEYNRALSALDALVFRRLRDRLGHVGRLFVTSPSFRDHFKVGPPDPKRPAAIKFVLRKPWDMKSLYSKDRMLWVLVSLSDQNLSLLEKQFALENYLDELGHTVDKEPQAQGGRISQRLWDAIGDLNATLELHSILQTHRPHYFTDPAIAKGLLSFELPGVEEAPMFGLAASLERPGQRWRSIILAQALNNRAEDDVDKLKERGLWELLEPFDKFRSSSIGSFNEIVASEKNATYALKHFWNRIDQAIATFGEGNEKGELLKVLLALERTPEAVYMPA